MKVLFNRPLRPANISEYIISDINKAKKRIALVSAWFTHTDLATAFVGSKAPEKVAVLNLADISRGSGPSRAVKIVQGWAEKVEDSPNLAGLAVLGSPDWQEGVMHYKYVVVDDTVWVGSHNMTFQAGHNYEVMLSFHDPNTADMFWQETRFLVKETMVYGHSGAQQLNGVFVCSECGRVCPDSQADPGHAVYGMYVCSMCVEGRARDNGHDGKVKRWEGAKITLCGQCEELMVEEKCNRPSHNTSWYCPCHYCDGCWEDVARQYQDMIAAGY